MQEGHYYQHELAKDTYIKVTSIVDNKVACMIYTYLSPMPWETMTFNLTDGQKRFWKQIKNPRE